MKHFKNISGLWIGICAVLFGIVGSFAFKGENLEAVEKAPVVITDEDGSTSTFYYAGSAQQKTFPLDTLTASSTTTITVPWNMSSPYQYSYFFKLRKLVGTPNMKVVLDQRNNSNSAIWSAIDSVAVSGADSTKLNFRLQGSIVYGSFHRLRFVKTGTNTMARNVELNIKPTN